jgi:hypothetical protein
VRRDDAKVSVHMDPVLVLASQHERTHRDVRGISPLDVLGGQIEVRVPSKEHTQKTSVF